MNRPAYIWEMDDTNTTQAFSIIGAYKYKNKEYIRYYDPRYGNKSTTYDALTKQGSNLKLESLQKPNNEEINRIGGILK